MTYTKLLEQWKQNKEEEAANRGSPFGIVKRSANPPESPKEKDEAAEGAEGDIVAHASSTTKAKKKSSLIDDK